MISAVWSQTVLGRSAPWPLSLILHTDLTVDQPLWSSITESFLLTKLMHWYFAEHPLTANAMTVTWLAVVLLARMRKHRSEVLVSTGDVADDRYPTSITSPMSLVLYTWRPVMSCHALRVVHAGYMHCDLGQPNTSAVINATRTCKNDV